VLIRTRVSALPAVIASLIVVSACSSPAQQLREVQKNIRGLTATTQAVADAWLTGDVSATYSRTAFQQTLRLLDTQRASLNSSPRLLADPRGAALSRDAEQLSRALAALIQDARNGDTASARGHLPQTPSRGGAP
jgi:hypothetical protein